MNKRNITWMRVGLTVGALLLSVIMADQSMAGPKTKAHDMTKATPSSNAAKATGRTSGSGMLDGWKFTGQITTAGSTEPIQDEISFEHGKLMSQLVTKDGFTALPYSASTKNGATTFKASSTNAKGDKIMWTGTIRDGNLEASVTSTPKGKTAVTSTAKAHREAVESPHN